MPYFARIENNKVMQCIVADPKEISKRAGKWIEYFEGRENNPKGKHAGIGDEYISQTKKFRDSKPYPSWNWSEEKYRWEAPTDIPLDRQLYQWNEKKQIWEV